jgi:phytanoyl-CoA hydroxylase
MNFESSIHKIAAGAEQPLPATDVQFYLDEGYLIWRDVLSAKEVQCLRDLIINVARGENDRRCSGDFRPDCSTEEIWSHLLSIHQAHYANSAVMTFAAHPLLTGALTQLVGAHLKYWDGSAKLVQTMFHPKRLGDRGFAWHQDERYIPTRDKSLIAVWIALDDVSVDSGTIWVVPKSHRFGFIFPCRRTADQENFEADHLESYGFDSSGTMPVEIDAGSVLFFNGYTLHKSMLNRSAQLRRTFICHFANAWSLVPWAVEPGTHAWNDDRTVVPVTKWDPYFWKGYNVPESIELRWRSRS